MSRPKNTEHKIKNTFIRRQPKKVKKYQINYNFLAYIRVVFKWAIRHSDLNRSQLEMLLYLHGKGIFTKKEFLDYYRLIGMYQGRAFTNFMEMGYITEWRERKYQQKALYTITQKGKQLCGRIHSYLMGDIPMPVSPRRNKMINKKVRSDGYYMEFIYEMNRLRDSKDDEEVEEID